MNYYTKILKYLIPIWIMVSINFSQDLSVDLTLLNTGQFSLNSWNNVAELWQLEIKNTGAVEIHYYLIFILKKDNEDIVEGHTKSFSIKSNDSITFVNLDPVFDQSILTYYYQASDFTSNINNQLGYLPPGNYTLELIAVDSGTGDILGSDEEEIEFKVGEHFSIEYPNDGQVFAGGGDFYFQWDTPGFRQGVNIEFRIIIAAIISDEVDSPEEAIAISYDSNTNSVFYFNSEWSELPIAGEWPYIETGTSVRLNFWNSYLINEMDMDPLQCGFDYAWRMDAREVIDGFETGSGDQGLWGWEEDDGKKSVVKKFTWGENPKGLVSPVGNDILPLFMWDNIGCAEDGFDIQISSVEDEDFSESWDADFISSPFQFPSDEPGLIPGESYKWRVRVHSLWGNTNWSEIEIFTFQSGIGCTEIIIGCPDETACNYDPIATEDDGSCIISNGITDSLLIGTWELTNVFGFNNHSCEGEPDTILTIPDDIQAIYEIKEDGIIYNSDSTISGYWWTYPDTNIFCQYTPQYDDLNCSAFYELIEDNNDFIINDQTPGGEWCLQLHFSRFELFIRSELIPFDYNITTYPNPFNPIVTISFSILEFGLTIITVYDLTGRQLETLTNEVLSIGNYSINWNASSYPSGVYLIRMDSGDFIQTQKVVLVK